MFCFLFFFCDSGTTTQTRGLPPLRCLERYFGFELKEDITEIPALQPELRDASGYYTALVNGGIITPAEARKALGFDFLDNTEDIRVPANIAGSAVNPDEGGRPVETAEGEE